MYQPDYGDPILICLVGGRVYKIRLDTDNSVTDLSAVFGEVMPVAEPRAYFCQAEAFLVIQSGDLTTNPLFYDFGIDGVRAERLWRSRGFVGVNNPLNQIPPAGPMDYYAQRIWYAFGRSYGAGDIVINKTSGTAAYEYRDSVLAVTENPVVYGGDAFIVPTNAGNIRALAHTSNLDTALGESQLMIFTRRAVYTCSAPMTRDDWTSTTLNNMPIQKLALNKGGAYSDRSIVPVNEDLFFVSPPDGDIRSMQTAVRFYGAWGNVPLSTNVNRVLAFNDRSLLSYSTGIQFDNRLLVASLPVDTPAGVGFNSIIPLDFDVISTFSERFPPAWEGTWDFSGGPQIMQLFEGDFGGRERAFSVVYSQLRSQVEIWEIRPDLRFENGDNRVTRVIEFPAYAFGDPYQLKELITAELWIDKLLGTVDFEVFYRPDGYACWIPWHAFQRCASKDCTEDPDVPCEDNGYPREPCFELDGIPITLPKPRSIPCVQSINDPSRPSNIGYQFQVKLKTKGWCRVRGLLVHANTKGRTPFSGLSCSVSSGTKLGEFTQF